MAHDEYIIQGFPQIRRFFGNGAKAHRKTRGHVSHIMPIPLRDIKDIAMAKMGNLSLCMP